MGEVHQIKPETYAYACECGCPEVVCFTDGDVMCNDCGAILDIEVINRKEVVINEQGHCS